MEINKESVALKEILTISFQLLQQIHTKIAELTEAEKTPESVNAIMFYRDMFEVLNGAIHPAFDIVHEITPEFTQFMTNKSLVIFKYIKEHKSPEKACACTYCKSKESNESI